jgi:para-nitrobenzyl esterase
MTASPIARGLFHKAIGESGAFFTVGEQTLALQPLTESERNGSELASRLGGEAGPDSLAKLRARPASEILDAAQRGPMTRFRPNADGYVLPDDVYAAYADGRQAPVPLLAGWNADEARGGVVLGPNKPTAASFTERIRKFGTEARRP